MKQRLERPETENFVLDALHDAFALLDAERRRFLDEQSLAELLDLLPSLVVLERADGARVVGSAVVLADRGFAAGRAVWAALRS